MTIVGGYTKEELEYNEKELNKLNKDSSICYGYVDGKIRKVGIVL